MDEIANHYEILDLQSDCTNEQIKQKFRQLALKYHPDKLNQGGQHEQGKDKKFEQIETAYRILSNEESRRRYDAEFSLMQANLPIINEQITVDELVKEQVDEETESAASPPNYEYGCRCGGFYRLSADQYQETLSKFDQNLIASLILCCNTCSLNVRLVKETGSDE